MEPVIIARFHAREGQEDAVESALREQVPKVRPEPGCLSITALRSTRDARLFFIHSRWRDEAAFDVHAELANTHSFVARMESLIDHPFEANRTTAITGND
jgi:quinol monooxygenase YgiN